MHTIKEIPKMTKKTFHKKKDKSAGPWQSSKSEKYSRVELACAVSFDQPGNLRFRIHETCF